MAGKPKGSRKGADATVKKRKTKKRVKDPNAPKQALSAYMFFLGDAREQLRTEQPELKPPEVVKTMGQMWNKLSEEKKAPYHAQAAAAKEEYKVQLAAYKAKQAELTATELEEE